MHCSHTAKWSRRRQGMCRRKGGSLKPRCEPFERGSIHVERVRQMIPVSGPASAGIMNT